MQLKHSKSRVLVIPDLQVPFQHVDALDFLQLVAETYQTTEVVNIGDSLDFSGLSRFTKDPDGISAGDEHKRSLAFFKEYYKVFPRGIEVYSNHNGRLYDRAKEAGIPRVFVKDMQEILGAPVTWSFKWSHEIDGVKYVHGDGFGGMHAARDGAVVSRQSVVIGHHHSHAGISYIANEKEMIFGMNVGCLIDKNAYAFKYATKTKYKPTLGCGVVLEGAPSWIPMILNKKGRWIRELAL